MKTIYFLYAMLFKKVSVMQIDEDLDGKNICWAALDTPQDGYNGHNGTWVESDTAINAVWSLRSATGNT